MTPIKPRDPKPTHTSKRVYSQATKTPTRLAARSYANRPRVLRFQTSRNERLELRTTAALTAAELVRKYTDANTTNSPTSRCTPWEARFTSDARYAGGSWPPKAWS